MFQPLEQPELVILVGNIGSGKSTLARRYVERGHICVSLDAIRYCIGAGSYRFDPELEPSVFACGKAMLQEFMNHHKDIVLDNANVSVKTRKKFIKLAKDNNYKVVAVVLPRLSLEESVNRRLSNNHGETDRQTWEMVWRRFDAAYQHPTFSEGFDFVTVRCSDRLAGEIE